MSTYDKKSERYQDRKHEKYDENISKFDDLMESLDLIETPQFTYAKDLYSKGGAPTINLMQGVGGAKYSGFDIDYDVSGGDTTFEYSQNIGNV